MLVVSFSVLLCTRAVEATVEATVEAAVEATVEAAVEALAVIAAPSSRTLT